MCNKKCIVFSSLLMLCMVAYSQASINVLCFELPPYCYKENGEYTGYVIDLYNEISKNIDSELGQVEIKPLSRAIHELDTGNTILLMFTRNKQREDNYQWIIPIYKDSFVFITPKDDIIINTIAMAKNSIGILTRSKASSEEFLLANGIEDIDSSPLTEELQFTKLLHNRSRIWFVPLQVGKIILHNNKAENLFNIGSPVGEIDFYMAASKNVPPAVIDKIKAAYKDIDVGRIQHKYGLD